ncbi:hypothetical protein CDD81_7472 [Ophiocordyceps australis]|uniref:Uncharacterized protein n=1 Tax=Ophiocordyceps australis TaxID=1399860 RepID=A0A2C5YCH5_9HYPO|nr:hypothetical protein CDD81_7472 [Ophiocordyceps australis]
MPSTSQRAPANTGRKAQTAPTTSAPKTTDTVQDAQEKLLEDVKNANTRANKANDQRDHYYNQLQAANQKLSESHAAKEELKHQMHALKEEAGSLRQRIRDLQREKVQLMDLTEQWEQSYNDVLAKYGPDKAHRSSDRPKSWNRKSWSKEQQREDRPRHDGREQREDRARKGEHDNKEHRAEKERLSRRFEEKRPTARGRRHSFMEPTWPSTSRAADRVFADMMSSSPSHANSGFSVPRTSVLMDGLGTGSLYKSGSRVLYHEGGGGGGGEMEDGNYHAWPIDHR